MGWQNVGWFGSGDTLKDSASSFLNEQEGMRVEVGKILTLGWNGSGVVGAIECLEGWIKSLAMFGPLLVFMFLCGLCFGSFL